MSNARMQISAIQDKYYDCKFSFTGDHDTFMEIVNECKELSKELGWKQFGFNKDLKAWVFRLEFLEPVMKRFPRANVASEIKNDYLAYVKEQRELDKATMIAKETPYPASAFDDVPLNPYHYQLQGINFGIFIGKGWINDDVRLGKLYQALGIVHALDLHWVIIICKAANASNWQIKFKDEILRDSYIFEDKLVPGEINIVPYPRLKKIGNMYMKGKKKVFELKDEYKDWQWEFMGIDEAHWIKSGRKSQRGFLTMLLAENSLRTLTLTGTPILSRPKELLPQIMVVDRQGDFGGEWGFLSRYCNAKKTRFGWDFNGASNIEELNKKIARFSIRRLQNEVWDDLPPEREVVEYLDLPEPKAYRKIEVEFSKEVFKSGDFYQNFYKSLAGMDKYQRAEAMLKFKKTDEYKKLTALGVIRMTKLQVEVARQKVQVVEGILQEYVDNKTKLVFFTEHVDFANELHRMFPQSVLVTGKTKDIEAERVKFQEDPDIIFAFATMGTGSEGLDFSAADDVMIGELRWLSEEIRQCTGRIKHSEKRNPLNITYLVMVGTVEEYMIKVLAGKDKTVSDVVKVQESVFEKIMEKLAA